MLFNRSSNPYSVYAEDRMRWDALPSSLVHPTQCPCAKGKNGAIEICHGHHVQLDHGFISAWSSQTWPGCSFGLLTSRVLQALVRAADEADECWDTALGMGADGTPRPRSQHAHGLSDAGVLLLKHLSKARPIKVGDARRLTIRHLAEKPSVFVGIAGKLRHVNNQPDEAKTLTLDVWRLADARWQASLYLQEGPGHACRRFQGALDQQGGA
jgi:hypothetical protein